MILFNSSSGQLLIKKASNNTKSFHELAQGQVKWEQIFCLAANTQPGSTFEWTKPTFKWMIGLKYYIYTDVVSFKLSQMVATSKIGLAIGRLVV